MASKLLEAIAVNQTRLRMPGVTLDGNGVALGARMLLLFPTLDRLVSFLAIYTRDRSLAEVVQAPVESERLEAFVVKSSMNTREIVLTVPVASTALADTMADVARLANATIFTGSGRYYVQYRDKSAPFGYDVTSLLRVENNSDFALHHSAFSQVYLREKELPLAQLMVRLEPRLDPKVTTDTSNMLWVVVEKGLARAFVEYLARSKISADVALLDVAQESTFDDTPSQKVLLRIVDLPKRMVRLVTNTPGIKAFIPVGSCAAVEVGFRHPVNLVGFPVFPTEGLTLLPGRIGRQSRKPLAVERLPSFASVESLLQVQFSDEGMPTAKAVALGKDLVTKIRLAASDTAGKAISVALLSIEHAPLLRRLAYALPSSVLRDTLIARVRLMYYGQSGTRQPEERIILRMPYGSGIIPLGLLFSERAPGLMVLGGHELFPACAPSLLAQRAGANSTHWVFVFREAGDDNETVRTFSFDTTAMVPLAEALTEPESWGAEMHVEVVALVRHELEAPLETIVMNDAGFRPMRNVE